jgi:hypothetical protein
MRQALSRGPRIHNKVSPPRVLYAPSFADTCGRGQRLTHAYYLIRYECLVSN